MRRALRILSATTCAIVVILPAIAQWRVYTIQSGTRGLAMRPDGLAYVNTPWVDAPPPSFTAVYFPRPDERHFLAAPLFYVTRHSTFILAPWWLIAPVVGTATIAVWMLTRPRRNARAFPVETVTVQFKETGMGFDVVAFHRGEPVGHAWCQEHESRVKVCDLEVRKEHRERGAGRALLKAVLARAQATGATEVWGWISRVDANHLDRLVAWYRRYGFQVLEPDEECYDRRAGRVVLHKIVWKNPTVKVHE
jgi:ribosomal protein S18 acetylase RimI-like enzyme